jgi:hypothetical protein
MQWSSHVAMGCCQSQLIDGAAARPAEAGTAAMLPASCKVWEWGCCMSWHPRQALFPCMVIAIYAYKTEHAPHCCRSVVLASPTPASGWCPAMLPPAASASFLERCQVTAAIGTSRAAVDHQRCQPWRMLCGRSTSILQAASTVNLGLRPAASPHRNSCKSLTKELLMQLCRYRLQSGVGYSICGAAAVQHADGVANPCLLFVSAGREKCVVVVNSAADEQQVDINVQLQSPGGQPRCIHQVACRHSIVSLSY